MTEKQLAILAGLGLSVIFVFCGLAFCLMGGTVPGLQTPTLQFDQATRIPQVTTEAPAVPPTIFIGTPVPIDEFEPGKPEELIAPPLPEELAPPSHDLKNLYTPLPGEEWSQ